MKKNDMGKEIFSIDGKAQKGDKYGLLKKPPHKFTAYENGIVIRYDSETTYIKKEDIDHIYRYYNVLGEYEADCLIINYKEYDEGFTFTLTENQYPNILDKIEELYKIVFGKSGIEYPNTVKWVLTIISSWLMIMERPHDFFGTPGQQKQQVESDREILVDDWGIKRKSELHAECEKRFEFPLIEQAKACYGLSDDTDDEEYDEQNVPYERQIIRNKIVANFDKTIKAYEMYRAILLAYLGYNARFFSYEEALDWCLRAGLELQKTYSSWDDYYENYLLGYCFWCCEDVDLEDTHANKRKVVYEEVKKYETHPWQIDWNTKLTKEW